MPKKPICLIFNASGHIGFAATAALLQNVNRDYSVRCGVTDPTTTTAKKLSDLGGHVVHLDTRRPETVVSAFSNVQRLVLIPPSSENRAEICTAIIGRARESGVKFIVFVSQLGAQLENNLFSRQFRSIERAVEGAGVPFCIVRPHWFMDNLFDFSPMIKRGVLALPTRDGRIPLIRIKDVAGAIANIIANPRNHEGKSYELTGPESLTGQEIAKNLSKTLCISVQFQSCPPEETFKLLTTCGYPEWRARGFVEWFNAIASNSSQISNVSNDLERILGKKPHTLEKWVKKNPHAFLY